MDPARFWANVEKTETCWLWTAGRTGAGYGVVVIDGATLLAHRVAFELVNGPIERGMFVCHHCDVRDCVNPEHLFTGTARDNTMDMVSKGRWDGGFRPGEAHPMARLDWATVGQIRARFAAGQRVGDLARAFGVSQPNVSRITTGRTWKGPA